MKVTVISKPGCPRCLAAKSKLERLGVSYTEAAAEDCGRVVADVEFPVILIDDVEYTYPAAMRRLKEIHLDT